MRVHKTPEDAKHHFENAYRDMSGQEVAEAAAIVAERAEQDDARRGTQSGALGKSLAGSALADGFRYEPVEGIGDQAMWNGTRREINVMGTSRIDYDSQLSMRIGNLEATVAFQFEEDEPRAYKDETVRLAKLVLEKL